MERLRTNGQAENKTTALPFGALFISPWAEGALAATETNWYFLLQRHLLGDWGDADEQERQGNKQALVGGGQVASTFPLPSGDTVVFLTDVSSGETSIVTAEEYESD